MDATARDAVAASPLVADSGELSIVFALVDGVEQDLGFFIPNDDHMGVTIEHDRLLRGRRPAPDRADEVMLNELAADAIGVDVGGEIEIATLTPDQVDAEDYFPPRGPVVDVRVVGVTRGPEDLIANGDATITTSPAMFDALSGADVFASYLGVRLKPGVTVAEFEDSLGSDFSGGARGDPVSFTARTKAVRDAISTLADGLVVFAIVAAARVGGRRRRSPSDGTSAAGRADQDVLVALGMSPAARFAGLVLRGGADCGRRGGVLAVAGALLASPLMPIGVGPSRPSRIPASPSTGRSSLIGFARRGRARECGGRASARGESSAAGVASAAARSTVARPGRGDSVGCRPNASPPAWSWRSTAAADDPEPIGDHRCHGRRDGGDRDPHLLGQPRPAPDIARRDGATRGRSTLNFTSDEVDGAAAELTADHEPSTTLRDGTRGSRTSTARR